MMKRVVRGYGISVSAIISMMVACSSGQDRSGDAPSIATPDRHPAQKLEAVQRDFSLVRSGSRVPLLSSGSARTIERRKDGLSPVFDDATTLRAEVVLPTHADRPATLTEPGTGTAIRFGLLHASHSEGAPVGSLVVYEDVGSGTDAFHRPSPDGLEDFVRFDRAPSRPELRYKVDVTGVAGVREFSNVVEFLDASGAPRLRVTAPWLVDASGREVPLRVAVEGCAADRDPRAPFDRPVLAPASPDCEVVVSWAGQDVKYPVLVDPAWTMAGNMALARTNHGAARMADGKVLVAGGDPGGSASITAEIFNPASGTWAMTGQLLVGRNGSDQSLVLMNNGKLLMATGFNLTSHEVYDPGSGTWSATGSVSVPRGAGQGVLLDDGKVLVAGGFYPESTRQSELYDPETNTYSKTTGLLAKGRYAHVFVKLTNGKALVAGGSGTQGGDYVATVELYDPVTKQWSPGAPMSVPRSTPGGAVLPDGRVIVAGGYSTGFPQTQDTTEIYDPATNTWTAGPKLLSRRGGFDMRLLADGRLLLAAGSNDTTLLTPVELLDVTKGSEETANLGGPPWTGPSLTVLGDGRVLLAGGGNISKSSYVFAFVAAGGGCSLNNECASGICVQGMCCDTLCDGTCQSCRASQKASGPDGVCGPVKAGIDPKNSCGLCQACSGTGTCSPVAAGSDPKDQCLDSGSPECDTDGECDGAGACRKYATPSGCTPRPCASDDDCKSGYCVDGICCDTACPGDNGDSRCVACSAAKKGAGLDGECGPVIADTDPDDDCPQGPNYPKSCLADGMCDGTGKCRIFAKDTVSCGDTQCISGNAVGLLCNGAGTCMQATVGCEPYVCKGTGCLQSCLSGNDCAPGRFCTSQGTCELKGVNGTPCDSGPGCQSGICADGVCCDSPCTGQCEACNVEPNVGACVPVQGAPVGTRPACAGTDPACAGQCDGVNRASCHFPATTIPCGTPTCTSGIAHSSHCDNQGACVAAEDKPCGSYACGAASCKTTCTSNTDCAQGYGCATEGVCVPGGASKNGQPCTEGQECQSGFCADGVCCNAACQGQCEACNVEPNVGSCSPVTGAPVGKRTACVTSDKDCKGACDGVNRAACGYPGADTSCGTPTCTSGVAHGSQCNGKGICVAADDQTCGAYACGDARCNTSCKALADCAEGYTCTAEGVCAPGSSCSEDLARTIGVGGELSCTPFLCDPGTGRCRVVCALSSECATGYVCDPASKTCIPGSQAAPASEDTGCGCRTAGNGGNGMAGLAGLALATLLAARKRRRN